MRSHSRWLGGWQAPRRCLPPPHPPTAQLRPHHCRWIVAAPGSGVERPANRKTKGAADKTADKTAESAAAFLADEGTRAAVAVVGESAAERVFNKHDPWAGLPDFVGFTPRLCAAAVDASLCAAIALPAGEVAMATMDTGLRPAIFVGVALFAMRDLCPLTGGRSPGKYLMGVDVHTVDEVNKPRTKAGKLQRGRAYPNWERAEMPQRLRRNAHYAAVLPLCLVGFPPDWVLLSAGGYCVALEAALAFYLQRSLADILGKTAVVKPKAVEAADAVKDPAALPPATGPFGQ